MALLNSLDNPPQFSEYVIVKVKEGPMWRGGLMVANYGSGCGYYLDTLFYTVTNQDKHIVNLTSRVHEIILRKSNLN